MSNIIKKASIFLVLIFSFLVMISCEDHEGGVTNHGEIGKDLVARFTRVVDNESIASINISENATSYLWDFGDGTTSTLINPVKSYEEGSYTVKLTAFNGGDTSTFQEIVVVEGCLVEACENTDPANGDLNFTFFNGNNNGEFGAFGAIESNIVANPVKDTVNSSDNVQMYNKTVGCETWSGSGFELNTPLDFKTLVNKIFKLKVFAEHQATNVTLLLEFKPHPNNTPNIAKTASITKVGEWQELTFDFSDVATGTFENMVIYFERDTPCDGDIYYFDDLTQTNK